MGALAGNGTAMASELRFVAFCCGCLAKMIEMDVASKKTVSADRSDEP